MQCGQCKREIREIDSLCCTEVPDNIEDKFEGKKCITLAHEFQLLYLNEKKKKRFSWFAWNSRRSPRKC